MLNPEVEGLDLTESIRESIKNSSKNCEISESEREKRPNSNFDQKGKHKERTAKKEKKKKKSKSSSSSKSSKSRKSSKSSKKGKKEKKSHEM